MTLEEIYKKYIDIPLYRVVPICDYSSIMKNGINPDKNPYEKIKPLVRELRKVVLRLEKKGFVVYLKWGMREVSGTYAIDVTIKDFSIGTIDFAPDKYAIKYYMAMPGGAATFNLKRMIDLINKRKFPITSKEKELLNKIQKFVSKRLCKNKTFYIKGSSKIFENALFSRRRKSNNNRRRKLIPSVYLPSPFGDFEHFKKIISKEGLRKYLYYLKNKEFFIRVKSKIPAGEIKWLR